MEFNQAELDHFRNSQRAHTKPKRERRVWGTLRTWDKFAFFLYATAFLLLLISIILFAAPTLIILVAELGMVSLLPTTLLAIPEMTLFLVATGTFVASVMLLLVARWRVLHNRDLRPECGCPVCQERELIRVRRKKRDRMFGFIGITAWRYACRNCTWGGLRVGGQRPLPAPKSVTIAPVEEVVYESDVPDFVIETETAIEEMPLATLPEIEVIEEVAFIEVAEEAVESIDKPQVDDFVETAVDELSQPDSQKMLPLEENPLQVAELDGNRFDSEFERLCYEAAQAK